MTYLVGLESAQHTTLFRKLEELRESDRVAFMNEFVLFPGGMRAVGFKIKYEELTLPKFADVLAALQADLSLRVIHLRRRNRLKRVVSKIAAGRINGVYTVLEGEVKPAAKRFSITADECVEDFMEVEQREQAFAAMFSGHAVFDVTYEDLVSQGSPILQEIQAFLGLVPQMLTPKTVKIIPENVSEALENYDELRSRFAGTTYEQFFDEAASRPKTADLDEEAT